MLHFTCPTCKTVLEVAAKEQAPHRPFCSARCQWIDLGKWFNEEYRISDPMTPDDMDETPPLIRRDFDPPNA